MFGLFVFDCWLVDFHNWNLSWVVKDSSQDFWYVRLLQHCIIFSIYSIFFHLDFSRNSPAVDAVAQMRCGIDNMMAGAR